MIPRVYEKLLDAALEAGDARLALSILMTMTAMTPLRPERLRQAPESGKGKLPEPDLSHLSNDEIRLLRKLFLGDEPPSDPKVAMTTTDGEEPPGPSLAGAKAEPTAQSDTDDDAELSDCDIESDSENVDAPTSASSSPLSSQPTVAAGVTRADLLAALGISPEEAPDGRTLLAALCR